MKRDNMEWMVWVEHPSIVYSNPNGSWGRMNSSINQSSLSTGIYLD